MWHPFRSHLRLNEAHEVNVVRFNMAAHEADLTGRTLDVLRRALGLSSEGDESFPAISMMEFSAKVKKRYTS